MAQDPFYNDEFDILTQQEQQPQVPGPMGPPPPDQGPSDVDRAYSRVADVEGARPSRGDEEYKPGWKRRLLSAGMVGASAYLTAGGKVQGPDFNTEDFLSPGFNDDMDQWENDLGAAKTEVDQLSRIEERKAKDADRAMRARVAEASIARSNAAAERSRRIEPVKPLRTPTSLVEAGLSSNPEFRARGEAMRAAGITDDATVAKTSTDARAVAAGETFDARRNAALVARKADELTAQGKASVQNSQALQDGLQEIDDTLNENIQALNKMLYEGGLDADVKVDIVARQQKLKEDAAERKRKLDAHHLQQGLRIRGVEAAIPPNPYAETQ